MQCVGLSQVKVKRMTKKVREGNYSILRFEHNTEKVIRYYLKIDYDKLKLYTANLEQPLKTKLVTDNNPQWT